MTRGDLSIVIPCLNAQQHLPRCLDALTIGLGKGLIKEVIVVDGGSTDHTIAIAGSAGCRVIATPTPGRGRQLKTGVQNAKADWLLCLHADTVLEPDWADLVNAQMYFPEFAATFTLAFDSASKQARWLEKIVHHRVRAFGLPYGDQGLLIHRSLYDAIGGYHDVPLMEDVEIIRAIGKRRLKTLATKAITSSDKYERDGWHNRSYKNAILLLRYLFGADLEKLAKSYT